jgi:hypothetical protein
MILPIVEGHGEMQAVPALIRRVAAAYASASYVEVGRAIRTGRSDIVKPNGIERVVELAARQTHSGDGILVVLDADDDLPCELGPLLLARAASIRPDRRTRVVVANREFEAWFLASARSLRGQRGLADDIEPPADPESIRDAKGWLSARTGRAQSYKPTVDQAALANLVDLEQASTARSFRKFVKEVVSLAREPA